MNQKELGWHGSRFFQGGTAASNGGRSIEIVQTELERIGYRVFRQVLVAGDFGVPQKRERLFIVALRHDLGVWNLKFPRPSEAKVSLLDVLVSGEDVTEHVVTRNDIVWLDRAEVEAQLSKNTQQPIRLGQIADGKQGYKIYDPQGHAVTLTARGGGLGGSTGLYLIEGKIRRLTPHACARVQGFPESFVLHPKVSIARKQFGNSIAVLVVKAIVQTMIEQGVLSM